MNNNNDLSVKALNQAKMFAWFLSIFRRIIKFAWFLLVGYYVFWHTSGLGYALFAIIFLVSFVLFVGVKVWDYMQELKKIRVDLFG